MAPTQSNNPFLLEEREPLPVGDRRFDPKIFKSWVEDLPKGNLGQTSREIYNTLRRLNRTEIPVSDRMRNLNQLQDSLMFVLDELAGSYIREPLPLSESNRNRSKLTNALYVLVIQAYKTVLDQYHNQSQAIQLLHKSSRIEAIHHLLYFLGRDLLHAYQLYQSPPEFIWKEIHSIYRYAVDHNLHKKPVNNEDPRLVAQSTATDLYLQVLLLSLAGPYRLLQGEALSVYMALKQWVSKCELLDLSTKVKGKEYFYVIDILSDAPTHYHGATGGDKIKKGWLLSTAGLAKQLANELEVRQGSKSENRTLRLNQDIDVVSMDLLARLMLTWGVGVRRSDKRNVSSGEVSIIMGLDALYDYLEGEPVNKGHVSRHPTQIQNLSHKRDKLINRINMVEGEKLELETDEFVVDGGPDLSQYGQEVQEEVSGQKLSTSSNLSIEDTPKAVDDSSLKCAIYNESVYGYHLYLSNTIVKKVRVGELVGIYKDYVNRVNKDLAIGVIRWMMLEQKGVLNFGVELLGSDAVPVVVRRMRTGKTVEDLKAFFLTRRRVEITLITPPLYVEDDDELYLYQAGRLRPVIFNQSLERTASFTQFIFESTSVQSMEADTESDDKNSDDDFESLWKNLT